MTFYIQPGFNLSDLLNNPPVKKKCGGGGERENNKNEEEKEEDFPGGERKKCDQEPIFKIYWSCLPLSKHYADYAAKSRRPFK